jgi:hypothetical protein
MERRLGRFECLNCGNTEPIHGSVEVAQALRGSGPQLTDATAGYKLLQREQQDSAQNLAETAHSEGRYDPRAKKARKPDILRDEKLVCLAIGAAGLGYDLYYWLKTPGGGVHLGEFATLILAPDRRLLATLILLGVVVYYLLCGAALFSGEKWLKWLALLLSLIIPLAFVAGILMGGLAYSICYSAAGAIAMVSGAALLLALGHDLSHQATGI